MAARSEAFGRLLKAGISSIAYVEGKTAPVVEEEIGQKLGVAGFTIQRYKAGHLPPELRMVRVLAEECVGRGLLGRSWLERFLHAAAYPGAADLANQLCPIAAQPQAPRVYENLPAPTYTQFVPREDLVAEIGGGLHQRVPVVLVTGFGGTGKTSLAREVAARCLQGADGMPRYDAVVWVSDKDAPGTTNLSLVLDEAARTLDYPGLIQLAFDEKRREVDQLLKRQRVMVVLDNLETVSDAALLSWLTVLPEPSKALVTSRELRRVLRNAWLVEVRGMGEDEARQLIAQRLRALRLDRLIPDPAALDPLSRLTGGNPKALELAVGLIKHERRSPAQIVADLEAARGELFDDLFRRAWALLEEPARRLLMALTFFPASASGPALQASAGVGAGSGPGGFDAAADRLCELALVDAQVADLERPPRYSLHPLVRAFAAAQLAAQPGLESDSRERWLGWCRGLAGQVGFCWSDLARLDQLDAEHETIQAAIAWAYPRRRHRETIELIEGVRYYYNVRGLWDDRLANNLLRAEAARALGDVSDEVLGLAHHAESLSKQGLLAEAAPFLARLHETADGAALSDDAAFEYQHARALYAHACRDLAAAEQVWRELIPFSARLGGQKYVINRRWLAVCLEQQGQLDEAERLYRESLDDALRIGDERSICGNQLRLAGIDLARGRDAVAEGTLLACRRIAEQYDDRRRLGEIARLGARLARRRGDLAAARAALIDAVELFERMGMRGQLAEARQALAALDGPDTRSVGG